MTHGFLPFTSSNTQRTVDKTVYKAQTPFRCNLQVKSSTAAMWGFFALVVATGLAWWQENIIMFSVQKQSRLIFYVRSCGTRKNTFFGIYG